MCSEAKRRFAVLHPGCPHDVEGQVDDAGPLEGGPFAVVDFHASVPHTSQAPFEIPAVVVALKKDRSVPGGPIRSFWKASQGHACRGQEDIWPGSRIGGARRDQRDAAQDGGDGRFRNSVAMPATSTQPPKMQVRAVASVTETPLGDR
jgi:hypothetical protein